MRSRDVSYRQTSNLNQSLEKRRLQIAAIISLTFVGSALIGGAIGMLRSNTNEGMLGFFSAALNAILSVLAYWAVPPGQTMIVSLPPNRTDTQTNQQIGGLQVNVTPPTEVTSIVEESVNEETMP